MCKDATKLLGEAIKRLTIMDTISECLVRQALELYESYIDQQDDDITALQEDLLKSEQQNDFLTDKLEKYERNK